MQIENNLKATAKAIQKLSKDLKSLPDEIEKRSKGQNPGEVTRGSASHNAFRAAIGEPAVPSIEEALTALTHE